MNLSDLNVNGALVLTEDNHNDRGNPHPQYLLESERYKNIKILNGGEVTGKYGEIFSFRIINFEANSFSAVIYVDEIGNAGSSNKNGWLKVSVSRINSTTYNVQGKAYGISKELFYLGKEKDSDGNLVVHVYMKNSVSWSSLYYKPCFITSTRAKFEECRLKFNTTPTNGVVKSSIPYEEMENCITQVIENVDSTVNRVTI